MKTGPAPAHRIELRVRQLAQLFNSMDPTPFLNRDLDPEAEAFIESWAKEFPPGGRIHITIHLEEPPQETDPNALAAEAIHNFFRYKANSRATTSINCCETDAQALRSASASWQFACSPPTRLASSPPVTSPPSCAKA